MKVILFVCGFNSHPDEQPDNLDIYESFTQYFKYSNYKLTFFRYKRDDSLDMVYTRLCDQIAKNEYNIIMGHSLGGGLLMKYMSEHEEKRKVILLMPFISVPTWKRVVSSCLHYSPFAFRLPKCIAIPNSSLFEGGNIINDYPTLLDLTQIKYAINSLFLTENQIVNVFNKNKDVVMVYADNELISPIECELLERIEKKIYVKGKHVPFADIVTTKQFFEEFEKLL